MPTKYKKRADGRYCTHVVIGITDDGKPSRKTIYAHTVRDLEEKAAEVRRQVSTGTVIKEESVTVAEWATEWLNTYKSGVSYKTQSIYKTMVFTHIIPFMGHLKLKDVKPHHVQRIINDKYANGLTRTVQQIAMTLKQIFSKAVENNLLIKNPASTVSLPKIQKPKKRALTDYEKDCITRAKLDNKSLAFLYVMMFAGLRRGEALALMRSDIDFKENTITVNKNLIKKGNRAEIKMSPKTDAGNRSIPMPDILIHALKEHMARTESLYIFTSVSGEIMSETAFRRFWEKIERRLNASMGGSQTLTVLASDVTPHMFRHTYATMLYYAGVDIKTAQYLLGHASINVTMEIYTHLDKSKTKEAAIKINNLMSSSQQVVNENNKS